MLKPTPGLGSKGLRLRVFGFMWSGASGLRAWGNLKRKNPLNPKPHMFMLRRQLLFLNARGIRGQISQVDPDRVYLEALLGFRV